MNLTDWHETEFNFPKHIPTMISKEERQYLFWLGASSWKGKGYVVEIGPWLGGSTWCLAQGMRQSGHSTDKQLVVYDNFVWREFMSVRAPLDLQPGDCFHADFLKNMSEHESIIDSWKQTLPDEIIDDAEAHSKRYLTSENVDPFQGVPGTEPVEILFVDGAKSWMGLKHLLLKVTDRLIPGTSLFVCQDFKYWGTYWVPMLSAMLGDHLQPIHNVMSATTVTSRLERAISRDWLDALPDHINDVSTEHGLQAIDQSAEMLRRHGDLAGAANVQLGKVMFLSHQNRIDEAVAAFRKSQATWPARANKGQLERARIYLSDIRSIYVSPGLLPEAGRLARRVAKKILKPQRRA